MVSRVAYSTHVITVGILLYLSTPAHTVHSTDTDATRPTSTHRRKLQNEQSHTLLNHKLGEDEVAERLCLEP